MARYDPHVIHEFVDLFTRYQQVDLIASKAGRDDGRHDARRGRRGHIAQQYVGVERRFMAWSRRPTLHLP